MLVGAYVLMEVPPPTDIKETVKLIREINGVKSANAVAGPYDVIAEIEGVDFNKIVNVVLDKFRKIEGIKETITLYIVP